MCPFVLLTLYPFGRPALSGMTEERQIYKNPKNLVGTGRLEEELTFKEGLIFVNDND